MKKTCDAVIPTPYGTDPSFENEGTARTYAGNITAAYKNRDLIEVPSSVADDWNEIAAALEIRSPLIR